jgi:hypothetical protein
LGTARTGQRYLKETRDTWRMPPLDGRASWLPDRGGRVGGGKGRADDLVALAGTHGRGCVRQGGAMPTCFCPSGLACFNRRYLKRIDHAINAIADEGQAMDQIQLRRTIILARRLVGLLVLLLFAFLNPATRPFAPNLMRVSAQTGVTVEKHLTVPVHCRIYGKYCLGKFLGGM